MLNLFNTLTRSKEEFKPIKKGKVGLYSCGPTVYWFPHIGNMRAYIFADILRRTLELNKYKVKQVMNITDVGHLSSDADDGDDKMILAMKREGKSAYDIARFYTDAFMGDMKKLNVKPAKVYPRATEHIKDQIKMIKKLEANGFTYKTSDGIYFDTSKLADYGRLSRQKADEKLAGARVELGEKKNPTDFALWKFSPPDQKREMEWASPWGAGFPGWHIECSAMSTKYLGVPFDIHTGGIDHIAVHHENELAQTKGALGALEANFWMHNEFMLVDGTKMSKSLVNFYTISDIIKRGFDPLAFRYFVLGAHYGTQLNFTWEALEGSKNALNHLRDIVRDWDKPAVGCAQYEANFRDAINDDLDTPRALAVFWEMARDEKMPTGARARSALLFDSVLGLGLERFVSRPVVAPANVRKLVAERENARKNKDFASSDALREQILAVGYVVEDSTDGPKLRENR